MKIGTPPMLVWRLIQAACEQDRAGGIDLDNLDESVLISELDILELDEARLECQRIVRAARAIQGLVEAAMTADIEANGAIRLGDEGFYVGTERKRRLIDPQGLCEWVGRTAGYEMVPKAFRLEPRVTVLRGIATDQGVDFDSVEGTFFEVSEGEVALRSVPASKTRWVERLEHGERR